MNKFFVRNSVVRKNVTDSFNRSLYDIIEKNAVAKNEDYFSESMTSVVNVIVMRTDVDEVLINKKTGEFYHIETFKFEDELTPFSDAVIRIGHKVLINILCNSDSYTLLKIVPRTCIVPVGSLAFNSRFYMYDTIIIDHKLKNEFRFSADFCNIEEIRNKYAKSFFEKILFSDFVVGGSKSE